MTLERLDAETLQQHRSRLLAIQETTPARWGGMDAARMICHLRAVFEMSLGEIEVPRLISPLIGKPLGLFVFYALPRLPRRRKGSSTPIPVLCPAPDLPFAEEVERLLAAMERFVTRLGTAAEAEAVHPILGSTSMKVWSRVHAVHCLHHERQFGLA